jgi:predicted enzyme related to lactoylglutathione lyase
MRICVCLVTADVRRLAEFYRTLFGVDPEGDETYVEFDCDPSWRLGIVTAESLDAITPGAHAAAWNRSVRLELEVADTDREYVRLQNVVTEWVVPPTDWPWGSRATWLRDPDGNLVRASTPRSARRCEDARMAVVTRLVTVVDINDRPISAEAFYAPVVDGPIPDGVEPGVQPTGTGAYGPVPVGSEPYVDDPRRMSLSALHVAVLDDGRRLTLLDDRGWTESGNHDIWKFTSVEDIEGTARVVVGPDEPPEGRTHDEEATLHWGSLAERLRRQGVVVDGAGLSRLPPRVGPAATAGCSIATGWGRRLPEKSKSIYIEFGAVSYT